MTILSMIAKERGNEKGEMLRLIRLVSKKVEKGYSAVEIADLFEKPSALIEALCALVEETPGLDEYERYDIFAGVQQEVA